MTPIGMPTPPKPSHSTRRRVALLVLLASTDLGFAQLSLSLSPERLRELEKSVSAQASHDAGQTNALLQLAEHYHEAATREQKDTAEKAEGFLRRLLALEPRHATARALLGSALTLKARDAHFPTTKLRLAREGFRELDDAVLQAPDDYRPRLVRGLNSAAVPRMFDRQKLAVEDLGWVHARPISEANFGGRPMRQRVAWEYGQLLFRMKNTDKAREVWQAGVAFDPGSTLAASIRSELNKIGKP
jgi:tetratricopeptide (TPR) repeat protein